MLEPEDNLSMNSKSNSLKLITVKNQEQTYLKTFLLFWFIRKPSMENK